MAICRHSVCESGRVYSPHKAVHRIQQKITLSRLPTPTNLFRSQHFTSDKKWLPIAEILIVRNRSFAIINTADYDLRRKVIWIASSLRSSRERNCAEY